MEGLLLEAQLCLSKIFTVFILLHVQKTTYLFIVLSTLVKDPNTQGTVCCPQGEGPLCGGARLRLTPGPVAPPATAGRAWEPSFMPQHTTGSLLLLLSDLYLTFQPT